MTLFKKNQAITIDKMNVLNKVVLNQDKVDFSINYSGITLDLESIPKLLADVMQLYAMAKPVLDRKSLEAKKKDVEDSEEDLGPIDLSDIPF